MRIITGLLQFILRGVWCYVVVFPTQAKQWKKQPTDWLIAIIFAHFPCISSKVFRILHLLVCTSTHAFILKVSVWQMLAECAEAVQVRACVAWYNPHLMFLVCSCLLCWLARQNVETIAAVIFTKAADHQITLYVHYTYISLMYVTNSSTIVHSEKLKTAMKSPSPSSIHTTVSELLIRLLAPPLCPLFLSKTWSFKVPHLIKITAVFEKPSIKSSTDYLMKDNNTCTRLFWPWNSWENKKLLESCEIT